MKAEYVRRTGFCLSFFVPLILSRRDVIIKCQIIRLCRIFPEEIKFLEDINHEKDPCAVDIQADPP